MLALMSKVSRMLVGGMKVIGVYVWVSDSAFKNSTITLFQVILAPCILTIFPVLVCLISLSSAKIELCFFLLMAALTDSEGCCRSCTYY